MFIIRYIMGYIIVIISFVFIFVEPIFDNLVPNKLQSRLKFPIYTLFTCLFCFGNIFFVIARKSVF